MSNQILSKGSHKIAKHHKSSLFTPDQEALLIQQLENFLSLKHPKSSTPIQKFITMFCKQHKIHLKGKGLISIKKTYAILNKYPRLSQLYWPERAQLRSNSSSNDSEGTLSHVGTPSSSVTQYSHSLEDRTKILEEKIEFLEKKCSKYENVIYSLISMARIGSIPNKEDFNVDKYFSFPSENTNGGSFSELLDTKPESWRSNFYDDKQ